MTVYSCNKPQSTANEMRQKEAAREVNGIHHKITLSELVKPSTRFRR